MIRKPVNRTRPSRREAVEDPNAAALRTPPRNYGPKPKPAPLPVTRILRWAAILAVVAYAAGTFLTR